MRPRKVVQIAVAHRGFNGHPDEPVVFALTEDGEIFCGIVARTAGAKRPDWAKLDPLPEAP